MNGTKQLLAHLIFAEAGVRQKIIAEMRSPCLVSSKTLRGGL
jgi:hypothetical protein